MATSVSQPIDVLGETHLKYVTALKSRLAYGKLCLVFDDWIGSLNHNGNDGIWAESLACDEAVAPTATEV